MVEMMKDAVVMITIGDEGRVDDFLNDGGVMKMVMFGVCVCVCGVFQEVTLSNQPSVGRLILAVLRDITG